MIHSASFTVSPVASIVYAWNLSCFEKWGRTDGWHVKIQWPLPVVPVGRPRESKKNINRLTNQRPKILFVQSWSKMYWSTRPTTIPAGSDHYFHTYCPSVPKVQNQDYWFFNNHCDNHCRPGLWAGRVDHWWLLSDFWYFRSKVNAVKNVSNYFFTPPITTKAFVTKWNQIC